MAIADFENEVFSAHAEVVPAFSSSEAYARCILRARGGSSR